MKFLKPQPRQFIQCIMATIALGLFNCQITSAIQTSPDPQLRGTIEGFEMREMPQVLWTYETKDRDDGGDVGLSSATVFDGTVYVGDDNGTLHAFESSTGKVKWRFPHGHRIYSTPICDGNRVYITSRVGIVAINCSDGSEAWTKLNREGEGVSDCIVWPGRIPKAGKISTVFYSTDAGEINAIDTRSGRSKWRSSLLENVPADPPGFDGNQARMAERACRPTGISTNGSVVIQSLFDQCRIIAFGCRSGAELWSFQTGGWILRAPAITDDEVFVASQSKKISCLSLETGEEKWSYQTGSRIESTPTIQGDQVFVPSCDGNLYCLDRSNGELIWKYRAGRTAIYCQPVIGDGCVFFASGDGHVHAVDPESGEAVWKLKALKDSDLYCEIANDGDRLFVTTRPKFSPKAGKSALIAIGYPK